MPTSTGNQTVATIDSLQSFVELTNGNHAAAGLYFYLMLDCLIDVAQRISMDFFKRPHLYTDVGGGGNAEAIAELMARIGAQETLPSKAQRSEIYSGIFGQTDAMTSDPSASFPRLRDDLLAAAAAFAERVFDTGADMLRARVRTAHRPFREYLVGLRGDSLNWSKEKALFHITEERAYKILRLPGVRAVFGVSSAAIAAWPYTEDANSDKVVEEASRALMIVDGMGMITRERISSYQRAALRGAEAIAAAIDFSDAAPNELDALIGRLYTWKAALANATTYPADPRAEERRPPTMAGAIARR